jgi:hypothetical protein
MTMSVSREYLADNSNSQQYNNQHYFYFKGRFNWYRHQCGFQMSHHYVLSMET